MFSTPMLIRHLCKLETVVFLHWCLICTVLFTVLVAAGGLRGCTILLLMYNVYCTKTFLYQGYSVPPRKCRGYVFSEKLFKVVANLLKYVFYARKIFIHVRFLSTPTPSNIQENKKMTKVEFEFKFEIYSFDNKVLAAKIFDAWKVSSVSWNTNFGFARRHPKWLLYLNEK